MKNIAIIDYGLGNLKSVYGAVEKIHHRPIISREKEILENADALIFPGVGAFADGMKNLNDYGLVESLSDLVLIRKKPVLAICLGMQLMAEESYEFGRHKGLGWLRGKVVKMGPSVLPLPHVGWNDFYRMKESTLLSDIKNGMFYFVHSYHFVPADETIVIGESEYGVRFVAAVQKENIWGVQFHPEKSQQDGIQLLKNFVELCV